MVYSIRGRNINDAVLTWPGKPEVAMAMRGRNAKVLGPSANSGAVTVSSALGTNTWEDRYDIMLKTGCGDSLAGFKLTAITACQTSIRSQSGRRLSGLLGISRCEIGSSICVGSPNLTFAYIKGAASLF